MTSAPGNTLGPLLRIALFAAAASLALYIPYKYATQLHAVTGLYAFLFPLSGLLAAAGMFFALKPGKACDCGTTLRGGIFGLSLLWLATGLMCAGTLTAAIIAQPLAGSIATFHMLVQHVFLSLALIALALAPRRVTSALGAAPDSARRAVAAGAAV